MWGLAKRLNLVGYVANAPDDRVIIHVEGNPQLVETFKKKVLATKAYDIEKYELVRKRFSGKYSDFIRMKCIGVEI